MTLPQPPRLVNTGDVRTALRSRGPTRGRYKVHPRPASLLHIFFILPTTVTLLQPHRNIDRTE
jgi:hypothetical protein